MVLRRGRFYILIKASFLFLSLSFLGASTGCSQKYAIGVGAVKASIGSGNSGADTGTTTPPVSVPGNDTPADDPNASRPAVVETFSAFQSSPITQEQSPKVRILMVIDNSKSTAPYQTTFSAGFQNFASRYFSSGLDLSVATITTDTYLAGTASGGGYGPNQGQCLSRLVPGVHDGPIPSIADGLSNPFTTGTCNLTSSALSRIRSNGDRSLRPILSTIPSDGSVSNASYVSQLISDFEMNAKPGVTGSGSERGFQSVYQFLKDNESRSACSQSPVTDPSCFFQHYNLANSVVKPINAIVFVSDEHDQSNSNFGLGESAPIDHDYDAYKTMSDSTLMSSSVTLARTFKSSLDKFFISLHETGNPDPNYSVFGITNITCKGTCGLQHGSRTNNEAWGIEYDALVDAYAGNNGSNGRPVQAADTVNSQASNSKLYDINSTGYDSLFDYIGTQIVSSTHLTMVYNYTLAQVPMANTVSAVLILANANRIAVPSDMISVAGNVVSLSSNITSLVPSPDSQVRVEISYK